MGLFKRLSVTVRIILISTATGALLAFVLTWGANFPKQPPPTHLPPLPTTPTTIAGILVGGFYNSIPNVRAADGHNYSLTWETDGGVWEIDDTADSLEPGEPCTASQMRRLAEAAGSIAECKTVQEYGEWCPGPYQSYAISAKNELWVLKTVTPCSYVSGILVVLFAAGFFVLGLVIVVLRALLKWAFKTSFAN